METTVTLPQSVAGTQLAVQTRTVGGATAVIQEVAPVNALSQVSGNITGSGQTVQINATDAAYMAFQISGTYAGVNLAFEVSMDGGVLWFPILSLRSDKTALESTTGALTNTARAWVCDVNGFTAFRVRATAYTSGTCAVLLAPCTGAMEPDPYVTLQAGSATIGAVTIATKTTGGALVAKLISAATTNATLIKNAAGTLYSIYVANTTASWRFLKLYNKSSAPTVGTDIPVMTIPIAPNSSGSVGIPSDTGIAFSAGIALAVTGAMPDADTTAVALYDVAANIVYA
ncbi:MAG: hypothetical protein PHY45_11660 [Rhodocyclaceae bacterium]|nr:hypothetical protein [Rhodocyclaceae bacterium]